MLAKSLERDAIRTATAQTQARCPGCGEDRLIERDFVLLAVGVLRVLEGVALVSGPSGPTSRLVSCSGPGSGARHSGPAAVVVRPAFLGMLLAHPAVLAVGRHGICTYTASGG